jgi:hypothetical protein
MTRVGCKVYCSNQHQILHRVDMYGSVYCFTCRRVSGICEVTNHNPDLDLVNSDR